MSGESTQHTPKKSLSDTEATLIEAASVTPPKRSETALIAPLESQARLKRRIESHTEIDAPPDLKRLAVFGMHEDNIKGGLEVGQLVYYLTDDPMKKKELELMCCTRYTMYGGDKEVTYTLKYWAGNGDCRFTGKGYLLSEVLVKESEFPNKIFFHKKEGMDYLEANDPEALERMERKNDHCQFKVGQRVYCVGHKNVPCGLFPDDVNCDITPYMVTDYSPNPNIWLPEVMLKQMSVEEAAFNGSPNTYYLLVREKCESPSSRVIIKQSPEQIVEQEDVDNRVISGAAAHFTPQYELALLHAQYCGLNMPFVRSFCEVGQTLWLKEDEGKRVETVIVVKIQHTWDGSNLGKFTYYAEFVNPNVGRKHIEFTNEKVAGMPQHWVNQSDDVKKILFLSPQKAAVFQNAQSMFKDKGIRFGADTFEGVKVGDKIFYVGPVNYREYPMDRFNHWTYKLDVNSWDVLEIIDNEEGAPYFREYICTQEDTTSILKVSDFGEYSFCNPHHALLKAKFIARMGVPISKRGPTSLAWKKQPSPTAHGRSQQSPTAQDSD